MQVRSKQQSDEDFPVASLLVAKQLRPLVSSYYTFARYADDLADNPKLSSAQKLAQLDKLENIFLGLKKYSGHKLSFAKKLHKEFAQENLSTSLISDLLVAFRRDSANFDYQTWGQLVDYCSHSAAPVGRFMLAIHNESPTTYQPAASLCVALQIVNHLHDIKYDYQVLQRVYLPAELMSQFGVSVADLGADSETPQLRALIAHISEQVRGLQQEGRLLPSIISSRRLRFQVCIIDSLTNIMLKKINRGDVLRREIRLNRWNWFCGIISGIARGIFTKIRTIRIGYEQH